MKLNHNVSRETSMKVSDKYMKMNHIKVHGVCTLNEFHNSSNENGFVLFLLFIDSGDKLRIIIDFGNNDMTLQQIYDDGEINDYYGIDVKINFLKLLHDISKITKTN